MEESSWERLGLYIMNELKRLSRSLELMKDDMDAFKDEVSKELLEIKLENAKINVKQGIWASLGSALPILGYIIYQYLNKTL